jgi:hypothetical protein
MVLTTLADNPGTLQIFCQVWGISELYRKPIVVRCNGCEGQLYLVMGTDTPMEIRDCQVFLTLELLSRGWHITRSGTPRCPRCGCRAE